MQAIILLVAGTMNILCFIVGAKVGQMVKNGEPIEIKVPKINPLKAVREHQRDKEADRKQKEFDAIMRNVDAYNGTAMGQEDI